jgi:hypothetical protein
MKKLFVVQLTALILVSAGLSGMLVATDVYSEVQDRIVSVLCLSCLKLEPKLNRVYNYETANGKPHPSFVVDNLTERIVFLYYSADACHGCDIMYPVILDFFDLNFGKEDMVATSVEFEGSEVAYFYANVDHTTQQMRESYDVYDVEGQGARPMFTIVTLKYDSGNVEPYYLSLYGTLGASDTEGRIAVLTEILQESLQLYNQNKEGYKST